MFTEEIHAEVEISIPEDMKIVAITVDLITHMTIRAERGADLPLQQGRVIFTKNNTYYYYIRQLGAKF